MGRGEGQITEEFMACVVKDNGRLRFAVGDRVRCNIGDGPRWASGKVIRVSLRALPRHSSARKRCRAMGSPLATPP